MLLSVQPANGVLTEIKGPVLMCNDKYSHHTADDDDKWVEIDGKDVYQLNLKSLSSFI